MASDCSASSDGKAFDQIVGIDWSGAQPPRGVAVAVAEGLLGNHPGRVCLVNPSGRYWQRTEVVAWLVDRMKAGQRLLIGIDCAFGMPFLPGLGYLDGRVPEVRGLAQLWDLVETASGDAPDHSGSAVVTDPLFAPSFWVNGPTPPHWGDGSKKRRLTERVAAAHGHGHPVSIFKLAAAAKQVGKASLAGMRSLRALRVALNDTLAVWPMEPVESKSVVCEIFPTLFRRQALASTRKVTERQTLEPAVARFGCLLDRSVAEVFNDHEGDAMIAAAGLYCLSQQAANWTPAGMTAEAAACEGWIFGVSEP